MTKEELLTRRAQLATDYKTGTMTRDEFLTELDAITRDYAASQSNPFYEFTNLLDTHVKLRMRTQGNPVSEKIVLDQIIAECLKRGTVLGEADK